MIVGSSDAKAPAQELEVTVKSAQGLREASHAGTTDPYCVVEVLGSQSRFQTKTLQRTVNPVWEETGTLIVARNGVVKVTIYDFDNALQDEVLGSVEIPSTSFADGSFEGRLPLQDAQAKGQASLQVGLRVLRNVQAPNSGSTARSSEGGAAALAVPPTLLQAFPDLDTWDQLKPCAPTRATGYGFYLYAQERNSSYSESLRQFFFVDLEDTDANWNMCDLALNAVSILDMFLDTFEGRFVHALAAVRVVRIVRLVRIVSLVPLLGPSKFVEDFSRVSHMAVEQMFNFLVVILASLLVLSVCATNMLWDFPDAEVAACYGNLGATMWTLFKIMTMDGWIDRVETVMVVHPNMLYFYAVFVFLSLSSVSIVPAIFIDILLEDLLKTRDEVRREEKRRKRARRAARRGVKGNYQKYHSSEALLSDSVHQSAESQPKAAWQDDISCHSDSSLSSGSSDADLAVETKAKEAPRSFTSGQRQSQSYHLVSSGPQDHELPLRDHAFQELLDDALESVSRCGELAQLSSELQLIQSGLEAHLQGLLKKLTAGVGSEPSARWPEQGSVKKVSVCTPSETPTLRLPPGRPAGSAYGSAPPGDREGPPRPTAVILERSSCLGQRALYGAASGSRDWWAPFAAMVMPDPFSLTTVPRTVKPEERRPSSQEEAQHLLEAYHRLLDQLLAAQESIEMDQERMAWGLLQAKQANPPDDFLDMQVLGLECTGWRAELARFASVLCRSWHRACVNADPGPGVAGCRSWSHRRPLSVSHAVWSVPAVAVVASETTRRSVSSMRPGLDHRHPLVTMHSATSYDAAAGKLVADECIGRGEVILEDKPILLVEDLPDEDPSGALWASDPEEFLRRCRRLRSQKALASFRKLNAEKRHAVLSLHVPDLEDWLAEEEVSKGDDEAFLFLRVLRVNGIEVPDGRTGLYATACRANHSCLPRARLSVDADGGVRIVALTSIRVGEEVTVSYLSESDLLEPSSIRRKLLSQTWGFLCTCQRCTMPDDRRTYTCPSCREGRIGFRSQYVQLGGATAELDGWAACAACGENAEAEKMANLEQLWARVHRRMPAWCRGADGRALLRGFLHPGAPPLSLSALEEMSEELSTPDELQLEESDRGGPTDAKALSDDLAAAVLLHRELVSRQLDSAVPASEAHWLTADAAGAALEAGLLLLKTSGMDEELLRAFQAQVASLQLQPDELVAAADCRLRSLQRALGKETLTVEAAELLRLKAQCLDLCKPAEAAAVRRHALDVASALLPGDSGYVFLFLDGLELRIRDFEEGCYKLSLAERRLSRCLDDLESQLELEAVQQSGLVDEVLASRLVEQRRVIQLQQVELDQLHFEHQVLAEEAARLREEVMVTISGAMPEEEEFGVSFADAPDSPQASERGRSAASPASAFSPESRLQARRTSARHSGSARRPSARRELNFGAF
ncbi:Mctp1 [Symbiodinium microadriaticum]|nr:Mctp1 [Symbiodinium microadriaticum]